MALYFRAKENGGTAFRIEDNTAHGRLDLQPLAELNARNGAIKLRRNVVLTKAEEEEVANWLKNRAAMLITHESETPKRAIEAINAAAHWFSSKPDPSIASSVREDLLLAMHDLRNTIVRQATDGHDDNET